VASIGYIAAAAGFHLPIVLVKDAAKPFPCMHSRCGCQDADQCLKSCCCHTAAERLAWARSRRVAPPKELILQAADEKLEFKQAAACCRGKATCAVTVVSSRPAAKNCCAQTACQLRPSETHPKCAVKEATRGNTRQSSEPDPTVSVIDALKCQGAGNTINGVLPAIPLPIDAWRPLEVCCGWIRAAHDSRTVLRPDLLLKPPIV
jgi:hypothetical protein